MYTLFPRCFSCFWSEGHLVLLGFRRVFFRGFFFLYDFLRLFTSTDSSITKATAAPLDWMVSEQIPESLQQRPVKDAALMSSHPRRHPETPEDPRRPAADRAPNSNIDANPQG